MWARGGLSAPARAQSEPALLPDHLRLFFSEELWSGDGPEEAEAEDGASAAEEESGLLAVRGCGGRGRGERDGGSLAFGLARDVDSHAGGTLLGALAAEKIFIPSACGGKGTCGVCRVHVHEGGGAMLPTEEGHISRGEAREGCRLSCQVKIKQDMKIEIEPEIFSVKKWKCKVISNDNVATFIKEFVVKLPEGETLDFQSGGFEVHGTTGVGADHRTGPRPFEGTSNGDQFAPAHLGGQFRLHHLECSPGTTAEALVIQLDKGGVGAHHVADRTVDTLGVA